MVLKIFTFSKLAIFAQRIEKSDYSNLIKRIQMLWRLKISLLHFTNFEGKINLEKIMLELVFNFQESITEFWQGLCQMSCWQHSHCMI